MAQRLIMIGGWTDIYDKAKACGFHLTVVQQKESIQPADLRLVDRLITAALGEKVVLELVTALHAETPFDAVVSFQEFGLLTAALLQERLGLRGNPLEPVLLTRDKCRMREHMRDKGVPSIPYARVSDAVQVTDFARRAGWPIIVKPANGAGSLQVHKLFGEEEVAPALAAIAADAKAADLIRHDFPEIGIIAEKFVEGPEVSVEAITWEGRHRILCVTDKMTTGHPGFVETGHTMPSALPADTLAAIAGLTADFLTSIGHRYGPSHTEIIVSADGPVIVESHTRTGGDRIFEMVELVTGIDMFGATLQGLAGSFPELQVKRQGGAAMRFLTLPQGRVTGIAGVEAARAAPGVVRCDIEIEAGDRTRSLQNSDDRPGYVLAVGDGAAQAHASALRAMAMLDIRVEPDNG